jgi:hypothetical protein
MPSVNETKITIADAHHQLKLLLQCDPLVGDTACHIRAIHLLFIYHLILKKIQQASSEQEEIILPISQSHLDACLILSQAKLQERDEHGIIISEKTDYSAQVLGKDSKTKKEKTIAKLRATVASESLNFLRTYYSSIALFVDGLEKYLHQESFLYLNSREQHIPILPFYISCKIALDIIQREKHLLIIDIKRIAVGKGSVAQKLLGSDVIYYRFDDNAQEFSVQKYETIDDKEPGFKVSMYSCYQPQASFGVEECFDQKDYATFIAGFQQQDIAKLILMCAAGHVQKPESARGHAAELEQDLVTIRDKSSPNLTDVPMDLGKCSKAEFQRFSLAAEKYGILCATRSSMAKEVSLQVNHAYLSTAGDSRMENDALKAKLGSGHPMKTFLQKMQAEAAPQIEVLENSARAVSPC